MNNGGERSQSADMAQMEDGSCGGVVVSWMTTKRAGERMKMWPMTVPTCGSENARSGRYLETVWGNTIQSISRVESFAIFSRSNFGVPPE